MATERCTVLEPEPFVGPETLADFTRGLKAVAGMRAYLVEAVARKAEEIVALEKDMAMASSYVDGLKGSFNVCPPIMASTDFRVMQMNVLDECAKNAEAWKRELGGNLAAARAEIDELTSNLYDMNDAVRLAETTPRCGCRGYAAVLATLDAMGPELDDVRGAIEALNDEAEAEAGKRNCPICWDRVSTHACVPCGHMYCERCAPTLLTCASCRTPVRQAIKVYYGF